jgi:hypothetical protein
MFERPADRLSAALALAAFALSTLSLAAAAVSRSYGFANLWLLVPLALAMLLVGSAWLRRQAPGSPFREMAVPAATATVMPLVVMGTAETYSARAVFILGAIAFFVLGARLAEAVPEQRRMAAIVASGALASLGAALSLVQLAGPLYAVARRRRRLE